MGADMASKYEAWADRTVVRDSDGQFASTGGVASKLVSRISDAIEEKRAPKKKAAKKATAKKKAAAPKKTVAKKATKKAAAPKKTTTPKKAVAPKKAVSKAVERISDEIGAAKYRPITRDEAQEMQDRAPSWTGSERRALLDYTYNSDHYNGLLDDDENLIGKMTSDRLNQVARQTKDVLYALYPSDRPIVVYRRTTASQFGISGNGVSKLGATVGKIFTQNRFMSTTVNGKLRFRGNVRMEIRVPAGTPLAFLRSVSQVPHEDEMLLAPELAYKVLSVDTKQKPAHVVVEIQPPLSRSSRDDWN